MRHDGGCRSPHEGACPPSAPRRVLKLRVTAVKPPDGRDYNVSARGEGLLPACVLCHTCSCASQCMFGGAARCHVDVGCFGRWLRLCETLGGVQLARCSSGCGRLLARRAAGRLFDAGVDQQPPACRRPWTADHQHQSRASSRWQTRCDCSSTKGRRGHRHRLRPHSFLEATPARGRGAMRCWCTSSSIAKKCCDAGPHSRPHRPIIISPTSETASSRQLGDPSRPHHLACRHLRRRRRSHRRPRRPRSSPRSWECSRSSTQQQAGRRGP